MAAVVAAAKPEEVAMETIAKVHVFEAAGLGVAPFRVVGCYEDRGPHKQMTPSGLMVEVGSPGQPMGSCKFCGQGIAVCYQIRSSDGRQFTVGCDCVAKTGDAGLKRATDKLKLAARHAADDARIADMQAKLAAQAPALAALPSPSGRGTMAEYVAWMMKHAGRTGRLRALKCAVKALEGGAL